MEECSKKTFEDPNTKIILKGYLATFTSAEEYSWASSLLTDRSWISGTDVNQVGKWIYSSGPEEGQQLYNNYFDKCYQFCNFGASEPNLLIDEHYIHTNADKTWNNNVNIASIKAYLCEFGGMELPLIPQSSTSGGEITITNIIGLDTSTLSISFTKIGSTSPTFQCNPIIVLNSTAVKCTIPSNIGSYNVTLSDQSLKKIYVPWQYNSPFISSIYPSFDTENRVTVTGENFGNDPNQLIVKFSDTQDISCNNIQFIRENLAFSCSLSTALGTKKFLPIGVTVGSLQTIAYKSALYYAGNSLFYAGFLTNSNFDTSFGFAKDLKLDGQYGRIGVVDSQDLSNFLIQALPKDQEWSFWQGIYYSSPYYKYMTGPKKDTVASPYNTSTSGTPTSSSRFYTKLLTSVMTAVTSGSSNTIAEFGGIKPSFNSILTHQVPTNGGPIELVINNFGTLFSTVTVVFKGNNLPFNLDFNSGIIKVNIPSGYDGPFEISSTVDTLATDPQTQFINYIGPSVSDVTSIPTNGGEIIISGDNFSNDKTAVSVDIGGVPCQNVEFVEPHKKIKCQYPSGSGIVEGGFVKVGNKKSNQFSLQYQPPQISEITSFKTPLGNVPVTIKGSNFGSNPNNIKVTIGSDQYDQVELNQEGNIVFNILPGQGRFPVKVMVSGLESTESIFFEYLSPSITEYQQTGRKLIITGTNFGESLNKLQLSIGSVSITTICSSTDTIIVCPQLPSDLISATIQITGSANDPQPFVFYLTPVITSISSNLIPTQGDTVTIDGFYFEASSYGQSNQLSVIDNGVVNPNNGRQTDKQLVYKILPGVGINRQLKIKSGGDKISDPISFSFMPPVISNVLQSGTTLQLVGTNFGSVSSEISISIGQLPTITNVVIVDPHTKVSLEIPDSAKNGPLTIKIAGQSYSFQYIRLKPIILSFSQPPVFGGQSTITGKFLSNTNQDGQDTKIKFLFNNQEARGCKQLSSSGTDYQYDCYVYFGSGLLNLVVNNDGTNSDPFQNYYQSPTLTSVTPVPYKYGGGVTIKGSGFAWGDTQVKIQGESCPIQDYIDTQTLVCQFSATIPPNGSPFNVWLNSSGQVVEKPLFEYPATKFGEIKQEDGSFIIMGENLPKATTLQYYYTPYSPTSGIRSANLLTNPAPGSIELQPEDTSNDKEIRLEPLPPTVTSGSLAISGALDPVPEQRVYLVPVITSITPNVIPSTGSKVTISGLYFEKQSYGTPNQFKVIDRNTERVLESTEIGDNMVEYYISSGIGKDHQISLMVGDRQSENQLFSFQPPDITSYSVKDGVLTLSGSNFGNDVSSAYFILNNKEIGAPESISDTMATKILPSEAYNGKLYIVVGEQASNPIVLELTPYLESLSPKPSLKGGLVSLVNKFFIQFNDFGEPITPIIITSDHPSINLTEKCTYNIKESPLVINCTFPPGTGRFNLNAKIGNSIKSNNLSTSYIEPSIQWASSIFYQEGGQITIGGDNFAETGLQVFVEDQECTNPKLLSEERIQCFYNGLVPPKSDGKSLGVKVIVDEVSSSNSVFRYKEKKECKTPCVKGTCDSESGVCICEQGYTGSDCSQESGGSSGSPSIDSNSGIIQIPGLGFQFNISVSHIREITPGSSPIQTLGLLQDLKWLSKNTTDSNKNHWNGKFEQNQASLDLTIQKYNQESKIEFAGESFTTPANSVKFQVGINSWKFEKPENQLQVIYRIETNAKNTYKCDPIPTTYKTDSSSESITKWVELDAASAILSAQFTQRIYIDSAIQTSSISVLNSNDELVIKHKPTQESDDGTQPQYNLFIAMTIPSFSTDCLLDPSFSATLKSGTTVEQEMQCSKRDNDDSNKKSWVIPVSVVVSVVGVAGIAVAGFFFFKHRQQRLKTKSALDAKLQGIAEGNTIQ
eukprot:gene1089-1380_t